MDLDQYLEKMITNTIVIWIRSKQYIEMKVQQMKWNDTKYGPILKDLKANVLKMEPKRRWNGMEAVSRVYLDFVSIYDPKPKVFQPILNYFFYNFYNSQTPKRKWRRIMKNDIVIILSQTNLSL